MSKKMLINVMHPEEARVAIVENGHLVELDIETAGSEQTRSNVYKGVVVRVEPGLQAAFVDIGLKKLGFLQMGELHPDFWQWRDDVPEENRKRRPRIQEVLRRGQEIIVQVEKGERDNKGAAVTTYLSLPGRYMVLMPGSDSAGISRKVESESERKKLKELVAELEIPEGIGYIMRTEAVGRKKTELAKDLDYLLKLYDGIKEKAAQVKAPAIIYQESGLVIRTIRDYFTAEIEEVLVDSKDVYKQARAFFKATMPKNEKLVKLHEEKRPIFSRYQIEEQIDLIYEKKVPLKSGGSLVIEPTEALVSIDVNSGKSTGEKGVEDTAFKTNMEAAEEAARQLRLRDLGGLIVIDFIDMRDRKHNADVEKTLKHALKADKARVTVGKISQFGMLEMSRQRIKQTLEQGSVLECPHCEGRGKVKSVESMALSFLRKVHAAAAKGTVAEVRGGLPLEVAYYLLNRKKQELARIETDYDIEVTVKGKPSFLMNQMEVELVKREKPLPVEAPAEEGGAAPVETGRETEETLDAAAAPAEGAEAKKKKRRRKKKGKGEGEAQPPEEAAPEAAEEAMPAGEATVKAEEAGAEPQPEEHRKKRRRRRRRGKGGAGVVGEAPAGELPEEAGEERAAAQSLPGTVAAGEEAVAGEAPAEEHRKKRRRRRRRGTKRHAEEALTMEGAEEPQAEAAPVMETAPVESAPGLSAQNPEVKPKKAARPRKKKPVEAVEAAEFPVPAEETGGEDITPEKPRRKAVRKKVEKAAALEAPAVSEHPADEGEEKPKRKRAPRKKQEAPAE